jgi:sugar/nucleoside kinase (ribokinase family)
LPARDVWVIGHVTRDRIRTPAAAEERAGGTATYSALALARLGANVGVLTRLAARGSGVCCGDRVHHIQALEGPSPVDPTGCGDTYVAAYLGERQSGRDAGESARFASAAAALKLGATGPLQATRERVLRLLAA